MRSSRWISSIGGKGRGWGFRAASGALNISCNALSSSSSGSGHDSPALLLFADICRWCYGRDCSYGLSVASSDQARSAVSKSLVCSAWISFLLASFLLEMYSRSNNALFRSRLSSVTHAFAKAGFTARFGRSRPPVSEMPQNGRDHSEISGRDAPKQMVAINRNDWSRWSEIRNEKLASSPA